MMRFTLLVAATSALFLAACDGPVECGTDPRGTLTFPSCAELDAEREVVVNESEGAILDRCYEEQCATDAPAEEAE